MKDFAKDGQATLHALTGKYARFNWNDECRAAFDELKYRMVNAPVMAFPRDEDTYILDCDASLESIGAVLSQIHYGEEKVIAYASRLYSISRTELLRNSEGTSSYGILL